jgi:hypothetical protein
MTGIYLHLFHGRCGPKECGVSPNSQKTARLPIILLLKHWPTALCLLLLYAGSLRFFKTLLNLRQSPVVMARDMGPYIKFHHLAQMFLFLDIIPTLLFHGVIVDSRLGYRYILPDSTFTFTTFEPPNYILQWVHFDPLYDLVLQIVPCMKKL